MVVVHKTLNWEASRIILYVDGTDLPILIFLPHITPTPHQHRSMSAIRHGDEPDSKPPGEGNEKYMVSEWREQRY